MNIIKLRKEDKTYWSDLALVLDRIYELADEQGLDWDKLAEKAGLAKSTVRKIGNRERRYPWFRTVYYLAQAVGQNIELVQAHKMRRQAEARRA